MRSFILTTVLVLGLAVPTFTAGPSVASDSEISVIYISAWNCPPCFVWQRNEQPKLEASLEYQHLKFRKIEVYMYQRINEKDRWPEDLEWLRESITSRGAPRWFIVKEQKLLLNAWGLSGWRDKAWPLIKILVAAKLTQG